MKKRCGVFIAVVVLTAGAAALLFFAAPKYGYIPIGAAVFFALWWTGFFHSIKYTLTINDIIIQSGIVFRKEKHIPIVNILWTTRVYLGNEKNVDIPLLTVIRTAGGHFVIFADYSTKC